MQIPFVYRKKWKMKREVFSDSYTEATASAKRKVVDENMLKYNEDHVNYANSKPSVFEVGIM